MNVERLIISAINKAMALWVAREDIELSQKIFPYLELPKVRAHGDLSTNVAFQLSAQLKCKPRDIANSLISDLQLSTDICERIEVAGPGFINFYLAKETVHSQLQEILDKGFEYGSNDSGAGKSYLIEFVSANPTGPLTIAHARQAAVGDALAKILSTLGYQATKEYYLNDRGRQMNLLARSTRIRYLELLGEKVEFPEDGYHGEYITDIAREILHEYGPKYQDIPEEETLSFFLDYSKKKILSMIEKDLKDFRVHFDSWISEKELVAADKVKEVLSVLKEKGYVYQEEGALWFAATKFGDDKDRVLIKSNGQMTYLAPDIAYHKSKYLRGFDDLIDIWGPDHHGYVPRLKAAVEALGHKKDSLQVLLVQLTTLFRKGQQVSMSTRAGEFISLRDLINEIGTDAARYFLVMRRPESHLDFDLEIAKQETSDNPVYYIQYAHARIASIFRKYEAVSNSSLQGLDWGKLDLSLLEEEEEMALIKYLVQYPVIVSLCARTLSPHLITDYLEGLVARFHAYYEKHRVIGSDLDLTKARIGLIKAIKIVLHNGLTLLAVAVPEEM